MKTILNRVLPLLKQLLITCLKIAASIGFGYLIYALLAPAAYAERGYMAYGGECLIAIAMSAIMGWFLFSQSTKEAEQHHSYKRIVVIVEQPLAKAKGRPPPLKRLSRRN